MFKTFTIAVGATALTFGTAAIAQQAANAPKPVTRAQAGSASDQMFAGVDTNHDGSLSAAEMQALQAKELQQLQAALRARGEAQFKALDTNKDGQVSLAEFLAILPQVRSNENSAQILQKFDTNHDGKISAAEFRAPRLAAFDRVDTNHDGTASVQEQQAAAQQRK